MNFHVLSHASLPLVPAATEGAYAISFYAEICRVPKEHERPAPFRPKSRAHCLRLKLRRVGTPPTEPFLLDS